MVIIKQDLWSFAGDADAICITTNGTVKKDGTAVMGKGCAKEAVNRIPDLASLVGKHIKANGNVPGIICSFPGSNTLIVTFPVKPAYLICRNPKAEVISYMSDRFHPGDRIPGWACKADLDLIEQSARILRQMADKHAWKKVIIPLPGCGAGELSWNQVEPVLEKYLDNRFIIVSK